MSREVGSEKRTHFGGEDGVWLVKLKTEREVTIGSVCTARQWKMGGTVFQNAQNVTFTRQCAFVRMISRESISVGI